MALTALSRPVRRAFDEITLGCDARGTYLPRSVSDKPFHEKAGGSQVGSLACFVGQGFVLSAESPLSPSFHPHSR